MSDSETSESEEFEMDSSFDRIQSALDKLERECCMEVPQCHRLICEMARIAQFYKIDLGTESPRSLRHIIERSKKDWRFLSMFVDFSVKWSDAEEVVVQDLGPESLVVKINAAADEMAEDLSQACRKKYIWRKRLDFFNLMLKWERKIEVFKLENREAFVTNLSGCSFQVWSPLLCRYHGRKFMGSVSQNLQSIISPSTFLYEDLRSIQEYLNIVGFLFNDRFPTNVIKEFFPRLARVFVRAAVQVCNCWFVQRDSMAAEDWVIRLRDLQHEISPSNPGFVELHLKALRALNKFRNEPSIVEEFLDYLVSNNSYNAPKKELGSLLSFVINTKLEDSREDVQSFILETGAILAEVRQHLDLQSVRCPMLYTKICLLLAEAFLKVEVCSSTFSIESRKYHAKKLNEALENLRGFSEDLSQENVEFGKQSFAVLKEVATEVASLYQSFEAKETTEHWVRKSLLLLIFKILLFKADSFLLELLDADAILDVKVKDQIRFLFDHIKIFRLYVTSQPVKDTDDVDMRFTDIEAIARRITFFSYAYYSNKITEEMMKNMSLSFSDLLEKIKLFKPKLRELCPFPRFNVPKIHELGLIDLLLGNLRELLKHDPDSIAPVRHHINKIHSDLKSMRSFLVKILESGTEDPKLKDLIYCVTDVAYRVEYVVESIEINVAGWQNFLWFSDLIEEIRFLKMQTSRIQEMNLGALVVNVTQVSEHIISWASEAENDEVEVDLNDEEEVIVNRFLLIESLLDHAPVL